MTGLFLAPATNRKGAYGHFRETVLDGVPREMYSNFIDEDLGSCAHVWGLTSSIKPTWENANKDDWVLFYTRENQYEYAAQIKEKHHNPDFGNAIREQLLEDVSSDRDWDYLLLFDDPIEISVSGDTVAELLDYGNRFPVRFIRVTSDRLEAIESEYDGVDGFITTIRENP
jgi:hypothetical protein